MGASISFLTPEHTCRKPLIPAGQYCAACHNDAAKHFLWESNVRTYADMYPDQHILEEYDSVDYSGWTKQVLGPYEGLPSRAVVSAGFRESYPLRERAPVVRVADVVAKHDDAGKVSSTTEAKDQARDCRNCHLCPKHRNGQSTGKEDGDVFVVGIDEEEEEGGVRERVHLR